MHYLLAATQGLLRIIRNYEFYKHISEAHDTQAYFSIRECDVFNLLQRVLVRVNNVIKKMHCVSYSFSQLFPTDFSIHDHLRQINGAQVAGFVRKQRLFTTWICGFYSSDFGSWILPVYFVDEYDTWVTAHPG